MSAARSSSKRNPRKRRDETALRAEIDRFVESRGWNRFHTPKNLAIALSVEASELAEIFQWLDGDQSRRLKGRERVHLEEEIADVFIYLIRLSDTYGIDLVEAGLKKMKKNRRKYPLSKAKALAKKIASV